MLYNLSSESKRVFEDQVIIWKPKWDEQSYGYWDKANIEIFENGIMILQKTDKNRQLEMKPGNKAYRNWVVVHVLSYDLKKIVVGKEVLLNEDSPRNHAISCHPFELLHMPLQEGMTTEQGPIYFNFQYVEVLRNFKNVITKFFLPNGAAADPNGATEENPKPGSANFVDMNKLYLI